MCHGNDTLLQMSNNYSQVCVIITIRQYCENKGECQLLKLFTEAPSTGECVGITFTCT